MLTLFVEGEGHIDFAVNREAESNPRSRRPRARRETICTRTLVSNNETSSAPAMSADRSAKALGRKADVNAGEESDRGVVCAEQRVAQGG